MSTAIQQPTHLQAFIAAMKSVYGPIDVISPSEAALWAPPSLLDPTWAHRGRYLWTDAFGVLNLLTLTQLTADTRYATLATRLVTAVHETLGRTRDGRARLPGASDDHPLAGGLRIGKAADEDDRAARGKHVDENGEEQEDDQGDEEVVPEDGDGQYHHYLTLWMFALNRVARATGERRYNDLAIELAQTVHTRFVWDREEARPKVYWKMSVDLSRPVVEWEGNGDAVDGYVVLSLLQRSHDDKTILSREIEDYRRMVSYDRQKTFRVSYDPLDLGMALWATQWAEGTREWADELSQLAIGYIGEIDKYFDAPAQSRIAYREFGVCLGIKCFLGQQVSKIEDHATLSHQSLYDPQQRHAITLVMHAAALIPGALQRDFLHELIEVDRLNSGLRTCNKQDSMDSTRGCAC